VWPKIRLLLLVAAVVGGGTALYPLWKASNADADSPALKVRYRTDTPATSAVAKPSLEVINGTKEPVPLADLALRYYFTGKGPSSYAFNCVNAAFGCSQVLGRVVPLDRPTATADRYLEIRFGRGAGNLAPGANSKGIDLQLFRIDHAALDQSDDRSFDATMTSYKETRKVTAYRGGVLVWGEEPDGAEAEENVTATPSAAPAAAPPLPDGVVFDDFSYVDAKDPALFKHGWLVRTSKGGPGIDDTWSADGVTFPSAQGAIGDSPVLQLRARTDGTRAGTEQASLGTAQSKFRGGTYAARVHFSDDPTTGKNGDHVNQTFYTIGSSGSAYSELDNEYMPNGGWGRFGPKLDTVTWYDHKVNDRVYTTTNKSLDGWHVLMITVGKDVVTYRLDGRVLFTSKGKYVPRTDMSVNFNHWFVDLPFKGDRAWDMKVDWFYYHANEVLSATQVQSAVEGFTGQGINYFDTVRGSQ
jgi:hypothetical protein